MFREIFFLAGENKKKLKFIFFLMGIRGIIKVIPLVILYLIILEFLEFNIDLYIIIELMVFLIIFFITINICDHYLVLFTMKLGHKLTFDIRMELGNKFRKLPLGYFIRRPTGELNTAMSEYVSKFESFISYAAPFIFSSLPFTAVMIMFFLILDWRMAFASASVIPLIIIAFKYADKIALRVTKRREKSLLKTNSLIVEFIQGMSEIKIFNQEASKFHRFKETLKEFRDKNIQAVIAVTLPSMILLTITSLSIAILLPLGLYFFFTNSLSLSILVFFIIAAPTFSDSLSTYFYAYMHVRSSMGLGMQHIYKILKESTLPEPKDDIELKKFDIEFNRVSFSYEEELVLKGISFRIPERSITALIGPSGAGKTTIINLIARFWDADSGEVKIGGRNIKEMKLDRLLSYISMVLQEVILFDDSILENIKLGQKDATDEEVISAAEIANCHKFIMNLPHGYKTIIGERGIKLSGGEKQRISIARAILKNSPILILDEATVYIDPENEKLVQEAINKLIKNKIVLVIAHRLSTIKSVDQILVIEEGKIVEKGNHKDLLSNNGLYSKLWDAHTAAQGWKI